MPGVEVLRARPRRKDRAAFFYQDSMFQRPAVKVSPAEYYVDTEGLVMTTVLGSCVAVCLMDKGGNICGMNHFMLPARGKGDSARYGLYAMELLINEMIKAGASRRSLTAKVYGGGAVIKGMSSIQIGKQNVEFCNEFLDKEGIIVTSRDVLDVYPRKVTMIGKGGRVIVQKLRDGGSALQEEARYAEKAASKPVGGEVTLF